jgi:hypothetical protein
MTETPDELRARALEVRQAMSDISDAVATIAAAADSAADSLLRLFELYTGKGSE